MRLLILFLLFSNSIISQVDFINVDSKNPSVNIIFSGVQNRIEIINDSIDSKTILIWKKDTINNYSDTYYIRGSRKTGSRDTLKMYKKGILVFQKEYQTQKIGEITYKIKNIKDSIVYLKVLLLNESIIIQTENELYNYRTSVWEFKSFIIKKSGKVIPLKNKIKERLKKLPYEKLEKKESYLTKKQRDAFEIRNTFSEDQLKKMRKMRKGDTLLIESVVFFTPTSVGIRLKQNLVYYIK